MKKRVVLILAGGGARRMGGRDKGEICLGGKRLIDHVVTRLSKQSDKILISGTHDYGTGLAIVPDQKEGPHGPAAGLFAALKQALDDRQIDGFYTVPVDGPFLPLDLIARLSASGRSMVASDKNGMHPTFAYWSCDALKAALSELIDRPSISLCSIAKTCGAGEVVWDEDRTFFNVNNPDDLGAAAHIHIELNDRQGASA